jgi:hypothetical protein
MLFGKDQCEEPSGHEPSDHRAKGRSYPSTPASFPRGNREDYALHSELAARSPAEPGASPPHGYSLEDLAEAVADAADHSDEYLESKEGGNSTSRVARMVAVWLRCAGSRSEWRTAGTFDRDKYEARLQELAARSPAPAGDAPREDALRERVATAISKEFGSMLAETSGQRGLPLDWCSRMADAALKALRGAVSPSPGTRA